MMNVALGTSALWSGRIDDALGHAESAIANFPEGADSVGVVQALATRGRALVRRGRLDPGFQLLVSAEADHPFGPPNDMLRTSIAAASVTVGDAARPSSTSTGSTRSTSTSLAGRSAMSRSGWRACKKATPMPPSNYSMRFRASPTTPRLAGDGRSRRLRAPPRGVRSRRMPTRWRRRAAVPIPIGFSLVSPAHVPQLEQVTMQALRLRLIGPGPRSRPAAIRSSRRLSLSLRRSWPRNSPSPSCRSVEQKPSRHSHGSVSLTQAGGRRCERRQASSRPVLSTLPARGRYRPRRHR